MLNTIDNAMGVGTVGTDQSQVPSQSAAPPTGNLIDTALAKSTAPAAATSTPNLIDAALAKYPTAPVGSTPNLIDAALSKPQAAPQSPSVWDKIKKFVSGPVKDFATKPLVGVGDVPEMQIPLALAQAGKTYLENNGHGTAAKVAGAYEGAEKGAVDTALGMTSPVNLGIMAFSGGLGAMRGVAGQAVARLVNLGFSVDSIYNAAKNVPEIWDAVKAGNTERAAELLTHAVGSTAMGIMAGSHAIGKVGGMAETDTAPASKSAVATTAATAPAAPTAPTVEVKPVEPETPIGQVLADKTPAVRLVNTAAEAKAVEDADTVSEKPGQARVVKDSHIPVVSKTAVLSDAIQNMVNDSKELQRIGVDPEKIEAQSDVKAMLDNAAAHISKNLDPRASSTITFDAQKQLASELGMTVEDLLSRQSGDAFNAEHAIGARMLLHDSQTRVMNLARNAATGDTDYQAEFTKALAQHKMILDTVKGMTAEAGRALGSFRIKEADLPAAKLTNALTDFNLSEDAQAQAAKLLARINPADPRQVNQFIADIKPSSTPDKLFEFYRNALLSSPKTAIVKGASEAAMLALEGMKKATVGGLSKIRSMATGEEPDAFGSEAYYYGKGAIQALQHVPDILAGRFSLEGMPEFEHSAGADSRAIKGTIGQAVRLPGEILSRQTNMIYALNYFGELNAQAARQAISEGLTGNNLRARQQFLADNPTDDMRAAANETALHGTFQQKLGDFGTAVQKAIAKAPYNLGRFFAPFFKTPINLMKTSGEFSPWGLFKGTLKGDVDAQAKGLIGSSIALGIAHLALDNIVTGGGPVDLHKKETLEATGWQPYSVKIGNRYFSYHRLEPLGLALGIVADAVHGIHSDTNVESSLSKADTLAAHIERNFSNFPLMSQLSELASLANSQSSTNLSTYLGRQLAGFIPALVGNAAEIQDPTIRRPQDIPQTFEARIPGMTKNVPPAIDVTGQPVKRPASALGGMNPFPVSTAKGDPVVSELARLGFSTPQAKPSVKLRGQDVPLSDTQSQQLLEGEGQALHDLLAPRVSTPDWKQLPDKQKLKLIERMRTRIREQQIGRLALDGLGPEPEE
jgi:hypothetical protein